MTMGERIYRTIDKSAWGAGPWQHEPDKVQWVDQASGLDCLAVRQASHGGWCGYVGVPEGHPLFGIGYGECTVNCGEDWCGHDPETLFAVHGGITYSDLCQEDADEATAICHLPFPGRPERVWWLGFDTAHSGDYSPGYGWRYAGLDSGVYRDLDYVRSECARLAEQIADYAP